MEEKRKKKMAGWKKVVLAVIILAVYLNIGWALGTYYHNSIFQKTPAELSFGQHIIAGWGGDNTVFTKGECSMSVAQVLFSLFWPLVPVFLVLISWCAAGIYYASWGVYYTLWFIFAGGGAKLLGLG